MHTGTEETFGQTVQEAMASGLPVVAPASGGPLDLVRPGVSGLLYPAEDDRALRAAVARLTADAGARARLGDAGWRAVQQRSWMTLCEDLIGHYRAVLSGRARTGIPSPSTVQDAA